MTSLKYRKRTVAAAVSALLSLSLGGLALAANAATAAAEEESPVSGDSRAIAAEGNPKTCSAAGLSGDIIAIWDLDDGQDTDKVDFEDGVPNQDQYLTILSADGYDVTGIVVKGGPAFNLYKPGARELSATPPWEDLHAPLNAQGTVPEISHWFVCATKTPPSTTPTTTEPPTTTTEPPTTTTEPPSTTTEPPSSEPSSEPPPSSEPSSEPPTTTSVSPVTTTSPAATTTTTSTTTTPLGVTGFGRGALIPIGLLLLVGGAAAVLIARLRRA